MRSILLILALIMSINTSLISQTDEKSNESTAQAEQIQIPEGFYDVIPADGAENVEIPVKFSWKVDGSSIEQYGHEFYFHTTSNVTDHMIAGPIKKEYIIKDLEPNTKYYWFVVAAGNKGYIPNTVMSFTTAAPKLETEKDKDEK